MGALLIAPGAAVLLLDLVSRDTQIFHWDGAAIRTYVFTALLSVLLWAALLAAAARSTGPHRWIARTLLVVLAGFTIGGQLYTFHRYGAYINHRAVLVGTSILPSVGQQLWCDRGAFLRAVLPSSSSRSRWWWPA